MSHRMLSRSPRLLFATVIVTPTLRRRHNPLSAKLIQPWTPPRRPARLWRPMAWLRSVPLTQSEAVAVETVSASPDSGSATANQQAETAAVPSSEARDTTGDTPLRDPQHDASAPNTP